MVVTLTHYGYIKRISLETYRAQRRGGRGVTAMSTREEDFAEQVFVTCTHNQLLFFTNKGKVYMKKCYQIPEAGRTAKGTAIVNMLNLDPDEKISAVFPIESEIEKDSNLMIVTKRGVVKKTPFTEYSNIRQNGLKAVNLRDDDELISVTETDGSKQIIVGTVSYTHLIQNPISSLITVQDHNRQETADYISKFVLLPKRSPSALHIW